MPAHARRAGPVAVLTALLATGCPGDGRAPVYPTEGKIVRRSGAKTDGLMVMFVPAAGADPSRPAARAYVEPDGTFRLTTYAANDGAAAGEHVVLVTPTARQVDESTLPPPPPADFGSPQKSPLRAVVEAKANALPPIEVP